MFFSNDYVGAIKKNAIFAKVKIIYLTARHEKTGLLAKGV